MSFDFIAPHYRWLEGITFLDKLQTARIAFIDQLGTPKRALITGEGDGRFLGELLCEHPAITVDCLDASARMLQLARKRVDGDSRVRFLHENLLNWSPEKNAYNLIVTHFFLDCFAKDEIADIVAKLASGATRNAIWLLADFSIPSRGPARLHAQIWLGAMYRWFRLTTRISGSRLVDPTGILQCHGFCLAARHLWQFGLIKSELWHRQFD